MRTDTPQPVGREVDFDFRPGLGRQDLVEEPVAETLPRRVCGRRSVVLGPVPAQGVPVLALLDPPSHLEATIRIGKRAVSQGVGGQLVQGHAHRHREFGRQHDPRALQRQAPPLTVRVQFGSQQPLERDGLRDVLGDQRVGPCERV